MSRPRPLLVVLCTAHAFAMPYAWCGLLLAILLVACPQGSTTRLPFPGAAAGASRWSSPVEVSVSAGYPWVSAETAARMLWVKTFPDPNPFSGFLSPPPVEVLAERGGMKVTRSPHTGDTGRYAVTVAVAWWWLLALPAPLGAWSVWRRGRSARAAAAAV